MFIFVDALTHLMFVKILVFKQLPLPERMKTASSPFPLCSAPAMLYRSLYPLCNGFVLEQNGSRAICEDCSEGLAFQIVFVEHASALIQGLCVN